MEKDSKSYLLDRFFTESLTIDEELEFDEYARTDGEFRWRMIRVIELHGFFNEFLGEMDDEDEEEASRD